ncbi:hypothetical protein [Chelatococcus reniformis]|uniref:hypothetical protein n=1 Tax=Chelatococcus reniformis TaxID=1494448 RepID=UPI00166D2589|nr:hypothetical protein [Chelatococcus reniformis]
MASAFKGFASSTREMSQLGREIGLTTDRLRAWSALGEKVGVTSDQMKNSLRSFYDTMGGIKERWSDAYSTLRAMNLGSLVEDLIKAPTMDEALTRVFEALGNIPDSRKRRRVLQLLGLPEDFSAIARELHGQVRRTVDDIETDLGRTSKQTEAAAQTFEDNWAKMGRSVERFRNEAFGPLLPEVSRALDALNKLGKGEWGGALKALDDIKVGTGSDPLGVFSARKAPGTIEEQLKRAEAQRDALQTVLPGMEGRGGGQDARRRLDKLNEEIKRLTDELARVREQGATIQKQSWGGGGVGGGAATIQTAAFGGFGGFGGIGVSPFGRGGGGGWSGGADDGDAAPRRGGGRGARRADAGEGGGPTSAKRPNVRYGRRERQGATAPLPAPRPRSPVQEMNENAPLPPPRTVGSLDEFRRHRRAAMGRPDGGEVGEDGMPAGAHTALKDLIAKREVGTTGPGGYNTVYARGRFLQPPRPITDMTIAEILAFQRQGKAIAGSPAYPVGRGQFVAKTLRAVALQNGLDLNTTKLTPELQERFMNQLIAGRGRSVGGLRGEWEGLVGVNGQTILNAYDDHVRSRARSPGEKPAAAAKPAQGFDDRLTRRPAPEDYSAPWDRRYRIGDAMMMRAAAARGGIAQAPGAKLEAAGTVNVHLSGGLEKLPARVSMEGLFKDARINRGKQMQPGEEI